MKPRNQEDRAIAATIDLVGCIVVQGGKPCTLINVSGSHKGGVLIAGTPVISFLKPRDAQRAVERTERVRDTLRGTLLDQWDRLQPLFHGGAFEIKLLGRQK